MRKGESKYWQLNDKQWLEEKYWGEGLSSLKIAGIVGCNKTTVLAAFKYLNISMRTRSAAQKNKTPISEETRKKLREVTKGENNPFFGKHHTKEANKKNSEAHKGQIPWNIGLKGFMAGEKNPWYGKRGSEHPVFGRKHTEEEKDKMREAQKGEKGYWYGKHFTEETKQKMRESAKKRWQDPNFVKKVFDGWNAKPNKQEKKVGTILQKYLPNEYAYNGDFSCGITIGGKIPDFVNVNGEKIVIEVFGPWHDEIFMREHFDDEISWKRTEFGTKAFYSQFGYKCVVFWQEDLEREDVEQFVLKKLKEEKVL